MIYTNDRNAYREAYFTAWQKYQANAPLEGIEKEIVEIILLHPEYHTFLNQPARYLQQEFAVEENPFLHMSLHFSVREQIRMNRPAGIKNIYQQLILTAATAHDAEHRMVDCLGQFLWAAQKTGVAPDESLYLAALQAL